MSNIEEDIDRIKQLNNLLKFFRTHGWIPDMSRELNKNETIEAIEHILAEREQDKKRIKELEENNLHWRGQYLIALDGIGMIPKQKVIDRINYCDERIRHAKQIRDKEQEEFYIDLRRAFNKLLEEK